MVECLRDNSYGKYFGYKHTPESELIGRFDVREKDKKFEIWNLTISKSFQNQGHGTQMLKEFLAEFKFDKPLVLYVLRNNAIAIHLYEKMGFVIVGDYGDHAYEMKYMGGNSK